jgi:hypothetical protein
MKKVENLMRVAMVLLVVSSCNSKQNATIEYVNDNEVGVREIKVQKLELDEQPLMPTSLCFVDTFLIICEDEEQIKTDFISVYTNNRLQKKFGKLGGGPTDMTVPMNLSDGKCEKQYLAIGSAASIIKYNIENLVNNDTLTCITESLPEEMSMCNSLIYDSDTLTITSCSGENRLTFYDKRNRETKGYSYFDKDFFSKRKISKFIYNMQVFPAICGCNNGNVLIAYTMQKSLDIVSKNGNLKKRIRFNNYDNNKTKIRLDNGGNLINVFYDEDASYYFCSSCVTDDAFFAISQEEFMSSSRSIIYKFDWDGNLLMKYYCNKVINAAVVNNGIIYSITESDDGEYEISYAEL